MENKMSSWCCSQPPTGQGSLPPTVWPTAARACCRLHCGQPARLGSLGHALSPHRPGIASLIIGLDAPNSSFQVSPEFTLSHFQPQGLSCFFMDLQGPTDHGIQDLHENNIHLLG